METFGIGMSRYLDSITTSSMAKKLAENSRTKCSSREEFVRSPMSRIALGKPVRKGLDRERMGESSGVGASLRSSTTRTLAICIHGRHQDGREVNDLQPTWKRLMKQVDLEKTNTIFGSSFLVMHST